MAKIVRDRDGTLRVGGTKVLVSLVVADIGEGLTMGELAEKYPSLTLADMALIEFKYCGNNDTSYDATNIKILQNKCN